MKEGKGLQLHTAVDRLAEAERDGGAGDERNGRRQTETEKTGEKESVSEGK